MQEKLNACFDLRFPFCFVCVVVNVFFDPDMYNVTEGDVAIITVRADREFTVPFSVNVTLQDGSAVGERNVYTYVCNYVHPVPL